MRGDRAGWIKLGRWEVEGCARAADPAWVAVWVRLRLWAEYEERQAAFRGREVLLLPGQVLTSLGELEEVTGVPKTKLRRMLLQMDKDNLIKYESDGVTSLISMINPDINAPKTSETKCDTVFETVFETKPVCITDCLKRIYEKNFGKVKRNLKQNLKQNVKQNGAHLIYKEEDKKKGKGKIMSTDDEKKLAEWENFYRRFREAHPQAERVPEHAFFAKCRVYPGADVGLAIERFGVDWAGAVFAGYITPLKEFGRYLQQTMGLDLERPPSGRVSAQKKEAPRRVFAGYTADSWKDEEGGR